MAIEKKKKKKISSNETVFNEAKGEYERALK